MSGRGKSRRPFACLDCKVDTGKIGEYYMLENSVWRLVHNAERGMLCIGCLESRLGRRLRRADFSLCYLNMLGFGNKSARLIERLTG